MLDDVAKKIFGASKRVLKGDPKKKAQLPNKVLNTIFDNVAEGEAEGVAQKLFGVKLSKPAAIVGSLGVASYVVGSGFMEQNHKGKMGQISASPVANSISSTPSVGIANASKMIEEDPELAEKFGKENISKTQSGVNPELVFALHELRNGG